MDMQLIAEKAFQLMQGASPRDGEHSNGDELAPGFFFLYHAPTGQSRTVIHHKETNTVFKEEYDADPVRASGRSLGTVNFDGKEYPVRLPYFQVFNINGTDVSASEYVDGANCGCASYSCGHARAMSRTTGYGDCHTGNWKINSKGEVVLFDFEGIQL